MIKIENSPIVTLIIICVGMFGLLGVITVMSNRYSLNSIKNKRIGHGQHGNARFASKAEISKTYKLCLIHLITGVKNNGGIIPLGTMGGYEKEGETSRNCCCRRCAYPEIGAAALVRPLFLYPNMEYAARSE
jgi:type IV secretion system protein VirD4